MTKILPLLLAIIGLVATVFVVGKSTGLINFAHDYTAPRTIITPSTLLVTEIGTLTLVSSSKEGCTPRPACLDANPPCKIAQVMPEKGWCQKNSTITYSLKTSDNRTYKLQIDNKALNISSYANKIVFVKGSLIRSITFAESSWWPLPNNLTFKVDEVQLAQPLLLTQETKQVIIKKATGNYANYNVYAVSDSIFLRSSQIDLQKHLNKTVSYVPSAYKLANGDLFYSITSVVRVKGCNSDADCNICPTGKACPAVVKSCVNGSCVTK